MSNAVSVVERKALDVCSSETKERIGFVIETGDRGRPWTAVAVLPADGNQFLGAFAKPRQAISALLANEEVLESG